jgi:hypothetical protein
MKPTLQQIAEHYRNGVGETCLVCEHPLHGSYTDYNGQIRCWTCGTTYQINGDHLQQTWKDDLGLKTGEVANRYCDCFAVLPLLRDYWHETHRKIPFGCYLTTNKIPPEDYDAFSDWLTANADKYAVDYASDFHWDKLQAVKA